MAPSHTILHPLSIIPLPITGDFPREAIVDIGVSFMIPGPSGRLSNERKTTTSDPQNVEPPTPSFVLRPTTSIHRPTSLLRFPSGTVGRCIHIVPIETFRTDSTAPDPPLLSSRGVAPEKTLVIPETHPLLPRCRERTRRVPPRTGLFGSPRPGTDPGALPLAQKCS